MRKWKTHEIAAVSVVALTAIALYAGWHIGTAPNVTALPNNSSQERPGTARVAGPSQLPALSKVSEASQLPGPPGVSGTSQTPKPFQVLSKDLPIAPGSKKGSDGAALAQDSTKPNADGVQNPIRRALSDDDREAKSAADKNLAQSVASWELGRTTFTHAETENSSKAIATITQPTESDIRALEEQIASQSKELPPSARAAFEVEAAKKLEALTNFPNKYKVVIRDLDAASGGEQHWYYEFNVDDPAPYGVKPNGDLILPPGVDPILNRKPWFNRGTPPQRLAHLFPMGDSSK